MFYLLHQSCIVTHHSPLTTLHTYSFPTQTPGVCEVEIADTWAQEGSLCNQLRRPVEAREAFARAAALYDRVVGVRDVRTVEAARRAAQVTERDAQAAKSVVWSMTVGE